eukprot:COSAG06_NODE_9349_length_1924_cov_0.986301_2_plen_25_part_01
MRKSKYTCVDSEEGSALPPAIAAAP